MRRYREVWVTVVAMVVMVGVWAALVEFTILTVAVILGLGALLSLGVLLLIHNETEPGYSPTLVATDAGAVGFGFLALCGLLALLGPGAWFLLPLWGVTRPRAVLSAVRVWRRRTATEGPNHRTASSGPGMIIEPSPLVVRPLVPEAMDLEELCWAWRRSYVQLQRCGTVRERMRVVAERQRFLDELERRNPQGLGAWLGSGARAAGNPTRYVIFAGTAADRDRAA